MKKLRRFNPPKLEEKLTVEFRENLNGIRIYEFNHRTCKYDKFVGIVFIVNEMFYLGSDYNIYPYKILPRKNFLEDNLEEFNFLLQEIFNDRDIYLTEEAVEYLESLKVMQKLIE